MLSTFLQDISEYLKVGMVVPVSIVKHTPTGAVVKYTCKNKKIKLPDVQGFVPRLHLTDSNMASPHLRHPVGKTVKARILDLESSPDDAPAKKPKVIFTLKSILVSSDLPLVTEYSDRYVGIEAEGVIIKVHPDRMFVQFAGNTVGLLHVNEYSEVSSFSNAHQVGNVIKTKVKEYRCDGKPMFFLTLVNKAAKSSGKRMLDPDFDVDAEKKKVVKKNRSESWLKSLKSSMSETYA